MAEWWSIEVFHGEFRARQWQDAYSSVPTGSPVTAGAGAASPRRPRPAAGAGAMALPGPGAGERADLTAATPPGLPYLAGHTP
ncbi:MAG TPA: hypothetical protein VEG33_11280 [Streptosporangiaceae bacterium]|nr:hypothetical protein [Streptosporangiaceae bacterium]